MASDLKKKCGLDHHRSVFIADHSTPHVCRYSKPHNFLSLENWHLRGMVHGKLLILQQFFYSLTQTWNKHTILSNYWMRLSRIWRILYIKEGVIHRGWRPRWLTPSEICRILHILRKPNSIIALLFIRNISPFLKEFRYFANCFFAHKK